jgi:oxygen-dependent protoporphyrinogen oxidase
MRSLVFGEDQPLSNAAAYGLHHLNLVRYTFSGRLARRHLSSSTDPERLLRLGETSLARYLRFTPAKRHSFVARTFDLGLCAYTPYHAAFLASIGREADSVRGLHLTGDYIQGASIEACFRSARACVRRIAGMLDHASDASEPALALRS